MNTRTQKTTNGWRAETDIKLDDRRMLRILTSKPSRGGIHTTASVHHQSGEFWSHVFFQDFNKTVISAPAARCTEHTVLDQHEQVIQRLADIKAEVSAHYEATATA